MKETLKNKLEDDNNENIHQIQCKEMVFRELHRKNKELMSSNYRMETELKTLEKCVYEQDNFIEEFRNRIGRKRC